MMTTGFLVVVCTAQLSGQRFEWVEDHDNLTTNDELEQQFGSLSDEKGVDDVLGKERTSPCYTFGLDRK